MKKIKTMKKILLVLLVFIGTVIRVDAQDIITKKDGNEIRAKVIEINPDAIKYKMFENQDGPVYVLPNAEIFMIKYENGTKKVFDVAPPIQSRIPVAASPYQGDWESQMRVTAPGIYQQYRKGSRQSKVGLGLMIGGTAAFITGAVIMGSAVENNTISEDDMGAVGAGALLYLSGAICTTVGTPIMIVGYVRKGKAKREYFSRYGNRTEYKSPLQAPHFEVRSNGLAFVF
jgi:nitrogen fixation protein FixH